MKHRNFMRFSITASLHLSVAAIAVVVCLLSAGASETSLAQSLDKVDRERGRTMLKVIKNEIKKNYYDPTYHGMDLDARFNAAEEKLDQATSLGQVFGIIAQALMDLDDSHTFFIPPERVSRVEYGWRMQMIGNKCYVVAVKAGSDAEAKGLKRGDMIRKVAGFEPTRDNLWKIQYLFYTLRPQAGLRVEIQSPDGQIREMDLLAKVQQGKRIVDLSGWSNSIDIWYWVRDIENDAHMNRYRYYELDDDVIIWKMPRFTDDDDAMNDMMARVKKHNTLILDLRGNPGGYVATLERLLGHFFDRDVKISEGRGRKKTKPSIAKSQGGRVFKGQLIVLVDSQSASAAEVFARVIQLEKRGTIIGDRTAGAVMVSLHYGFDIGFTTVLPYGASITIYDLIMNDGKSLEKVGVTPDEVLLPMATDLAANRDPVLSLAVEMAGKKMDPEKAGALFPVEWKK